jgi:hypothetical protein
MGAVDDGGRSNHRTLRSFRTLVVAVPPRPVRLVAVIYSGSKNILVQFSACNFSVYAGASDRTIERPKINIQIFELDGPIAGPRSPKGILNSSPGSPAGSIAYRTAIAR